MKTLSIDIETYSDAPLKKCGVYRYCEDSSFEILLFPARPPAWQIRRVKSLSSTSLSQDRKSSSRSVAKSSAAEVRPLSGSPSPPPGRRCRAGRRGVQGGLVRQRQQHHRAPDRGPGRPAHSGPALNSVKSSPAPVLVRAGRLSVTGTRVGRPWGFSFAPPPLLSDEEIEEILGKLDDLTKWASEIQAYAHRTAGARPRHTASSGDSLRPPPEHLDHT